MIQFNRLDLLLCREYVEGSKHKNRKDLGVPAVDMVKVYQGLYLCVGIIMKMDCPWVLRLEDKL